MIWLKFPEFNQYSTPLLLLIVQAYIFAVLLIFRHLKTKEVADWLLAILLFMQGHHCFSYIIGFMDWYDTYPNTKINYFLFDFTYAIGPLVYFYVRRLTQPKFTVENRHWWHFVPAMVIFIYQWIYFAYDMSQPGFAEVQNGIWKENMDTLYIDPFLTIFGYYSQLLYYAFSSQLYWNYRRQIREIYSNTGRVALNWIAHFLAAWVLLFLFHTFMEVLNVAILPLHWTQNWWSYFASAIVILYLGIKGYLTNIPQITQLKKTETATLYANQQAQIKPIDWTPQKIWLQQIMQSQKPFLNPDLTLPELAKLLEINTTKLSQLLNHGFQQNFNDFINSYRVEAVKEQLQHSSKKHLSLLGIAQDCGFNSKATFNRTFKKMVGQTPSAYAKESLQAN